MNKFKFYFLSFTWGLPMTLIGCIVALVLLITGHKPKKYGYCWHFEVGKYWGGVNLGIVLLTYKASTARIKNHEHGHGWQNCYFGVLMPFLVCLPSAARYWLRTCKTINGKRVFSFVLWGVCLAIGAVLIALGVINQIWYIFGVGAFVAVYFTSLCVWLLFIETPQYKKGYIDYDNFWAEADATRRGTEFIKSLGEKNYVN